MKTTQHKSNVCLFGEYAATTKLQIMFKETAAITVLCVHAFQSLIVVTGNTFTIFVFWIHRIKLKRTSFFLINLAVADLLVGFTDFVVLGTHAFPRHIGISRENKTPILIKGNIATSFQAVFSIVSVFFLVLISLERAFALLWPLWHRVTSTKAYIYSVFIVWVAGITVGALSLLTVYDLLDFRYYLISVCVIITFSLATICVSYLAIRTRLHRRVPAMDTAHNRQRGEQNTKLSKTLFIVIAASLVFWIPSVVVYCVHSLSKGMFSDVVVYIFTMLHLTNSLVNPIIYSLRMPMFRETLKRLKNKLKIRKQSKRYTINHQRS